METFDILFSHIQRKVSLSEQDKDIIKTFFVARKLVKKEYLLQEGELCRYMAFVNTGLLRVYHIDEKGNEHMNLFGWEGWWLSDFNSFLTGETAISYIDALEDSELLLLSRSDYEALTVKVPIMDRFFRILYQNSILTKERRLRNAITFSAKDRYLEFIESNPQVCERIPQHLIASYLGIVPETLSRLKRKIGDQ